MGCKAVFLPWKAMIRLLARPSKWAFKASKREISTKEKIKGQIGAVGASSGGAFTATVIRVTDDGGFGACWTDIERDVFDAMHG